MQLVFTDQAINHLKECLDFLSPDVDDEKRIQLREAILTKANKLLSTPYMGQKEMYLDHLAQDHRRIIERYHKIIYRVEGDVIYITDIFDSRQDPAKMK